MRKTVITAALALSAAALAQPAQADAGPGPMPKVKGMGLVAAYEALHYPLGITFKDGRGSGRHVLWPARWKVCDQQPAPGFHTDERKITLIVVKKDEQCATPPRAQRAARGAAGKTA